MAQIYAIAHIGNKKLFVGDASQISILWPHLLTQLNSGLHPNRELQTLWNQQANQRYFSFHVKEDLLDDPEIIGIDSDLL